MDAPSESSPDPRPADSVLLDRVYDELRALAERRLAAEPPGQTLQATALVHEAWLQLAGKSDRVWNDPRHFYAAAARAIRRILVDNARRKHAARHGGGWLRVDLPDFEPASAGDATPDDTVAALGEALDHLATTHPRHAEIVQLRFFAGLTLEQAAAVVGISVPTAKRDWAFARAWLFRQLQRSREEDRGT